MSSIPSLRLPPTPSSDNGQVIILPSTPMARNVENVEHYQMPADVLARLVKRASETPAPKLPDSDDEKTTRPRSLSVTIVSEASPIIVPRTVVSKERKEELRRLAHEGDFISMCEYAKACDPTYTDGAQGNKHAIVWYQKAREVAKKEKRSEYSFGELSYLLGVAYRNKSEFEIAYQIFMEGTLTGNYKCLYEIGCLFLIKQVPKYINLNTNSKAANYFRLAIIAANKVGNEEYFEGDLEGEFNLKDRIQIANTFKEQAEERLAKIAPPKVITRHYSS